MRILEYTGLDTARVAAQYCKATEAIAREDFRAAEGGPTETSQSAGPRRERWSLAPSSMAKQVKPIPAPPVGNHLDFVFDVLRTDQLLTQFTQYFVTASAPSGYGRFAAQPAVLDPCVRNPTQLWF
jgi:hypothetical protein